LHETWLVIRQGRLVGDPGLGALATQSIVRGEAPLPNRKRDGTEASF
jgi:hypothetical protein